MKAFLRLTLLTVLVLLIIPTMAKGQLFFFQNPVIGKQAIDFQLKNLAGEEVQFSQVRGQKPAIIIFWATWCPYCRDELNRLQARADLFNPKEIKVFLVNVEESPAEIKSLTNRYEWPFEVLLDSKSTVSNQYGVSGLPSVFLVNRDGVVVSMNYEIPANFAKILALSQPGKR